MDLIIKQEPEVFESIDYKHKKFDVRSKRIRYDSNSSTECSSTSTSTVRPATNDITTRNNDTPLSIFCDYNNFQPGRQKRNWVTLTAETSTQSPLKRRRLLREETNDSGFLMPTQQTIDDDDALLIPAPPRFTSTPLSLLATVASATTPLKRRYNHIYESNDSGISMTPHKVEDDAASVASTSTHHSRAYPRYTSTPLAILATMAATTSPPPPAPHIAVIMPKISDAAMHSICKYHGNMVRKFPKKERTPKDQERRNKNTIACRMSRRLKKLENVAVEEQYKEFTKQYFEVVEASIRATAYLNALTIKLTAVSSSRVSISPDRAVKLPVKKLRTPVIGRRQPKPFSIEYLTGNSNNSRVFQNVLK